MTSTSSTKICEIFVFILSPIWQRIVITDHRIVQRRIHTTKENQIHTYVAVVDAVKEISNENQLVHHIYSEFSPTTFHKRLVCDAVSPSSIHSDRGNFFIFLIFFIYISYFFHRTLLAFLRMYLSLRPFNETKINNEILIERVAIDCMSKYVVLHTIYRHLQAAFVPNK